MEKKLYCAIKGIGVCLLCVFSLCLLTGCKSENEDKDETIEYVSITMSEATRRFDVDNDYILVDVRRPDEYSDGHIPNAINIPNEDIGTTEPEQLADKDQTIYIYCRSGIRSKEASAKLVAMGYTHIIECGGILDWEGVIER